jgi:hypothetical protein
MRRAASQGNAPMAVTRSSHTRVLGVSASHFRCVSLALFGVGASLERRAKMVG